jgi:hypothetical protein
MFINFLGNIFYARKHNTIVSLYIVNVTLLLTSYIHLYKLYLKICNSSENVSTRLLWKIRLVLFFTREWMWSRGAVYQWCGFKSRRGKNKNLTALKSNSNTVWLNFQTYIYISYIYIYKGPSWPRSYGSYIYVYRCIQCLSSWKWKIRSQVAMSAQ